MKKLALMALAFLGLSMLPGLACESFAAYPEKEIRLIVPYKAGGQSDLTARKLAEIIQAKKLLPQPVLVVNIPGANTQEGLRNVLRSKPDGYTLLLHHSAFVTMKELGQISMSFRDFKMVGQALVMGNSLVVNSDSPFKDMSSFVKAVKEKPGQYKVAIPGIGGVAHLAMLDVLNRLQILDKVEIIPFDGANEAITALMSKRCDMRTATNSDMARFVRSGEQRPLMIIGNEALPGIDAPQYAKDLGIETPLVLRNGVFAPKKTADEHLDVFATAMKAAVESPEFQDFAAKQAAAGVFLDSAEWAKAYAADEVTVRALVSALKK